MCVCVCEYYNTIIIIIWSIIIIVNLISWKNVNNLIFTINVWIAEKKFLKKKKIFSAIYLSINKKKLFPNIAL